MTANIGSLDRIIRLTLGFVLVALPFVTDLGSMTLTVVSIAFGLVMLAVAATRVCPLYAILGIRTCRT